jgi:hypothetical protein
VSIPSSALSIGIDGLSQGFLRVVNGPSLTLQEVEDPHVHRHIYSMATASVPTYFRISPSR